MTVEIQELSVMRIDLPDGRVEVKQYQGFPRYVGLSPRLFMEKWRREFIQPDEGGVTLTLTNGSARYNFISWHPEGYWVAEKQWERDVEEVASW